MNVLRETSIWGRENPELTEVLPFFPTKHTLKNNHQATSHSF